MQREFWKSYKKTLIAFLNHYQNGLDIKNQAAKPTKLPQTLNLLYLWSNENEQKIMLTTVIILQLSNDTFPV